MKTTTPNTRKNKMAKTNNNMECSEVEALNFPPPVDMRESLVNKYFRIKTTNGILIFVCVSHTEDNISFEQCWIGKSPYGPAFANMDHGEFIDQHSLGRIEAMGARPPLKEIRKVVSRARQYLRDCGCNRFEARVCPESEGDDHSGHYQNLNQLSRSGIPGETYACEGWKASRDDTYGNGDFVYVTIPTETDPGKVVAVKGWGQQKQL